MVTFIKMLQRMELEVNTEKTSMVNVEEEPFDFLGFTFRYDKDLFGEDKKYLNIIPGKKSGVSLRSRIREQLRNNRHKNPAEISRMLNRTIIGWINYYDIPKVSYPQVEKGKIRFYLSEALYRYYRRKSQRRCKLYRQRAFEVLIKRYGLIDPSKYTLAN